MIADSIVQTYDVKVGDETLTLAKKKTAKTNFDDGVVFDIAGEGGARPRHLQFHCKLNGDDGEGCDIRLAKRL